MKLTSLTVQSFRGFGRREQFFLGDVNVLGGPNGYGKTSFFDAALWCLFESIPRLGGTRDFVQAKDIYQNKFSQSTYSVEAAFDTAEGPLSLLRRSGTAQASIAGKAIDEKECLHRLNLHDEGAIDRFLRNSMLEQEKINDFVRQLNPRERYDSMTSVLRFTTNELSDQIEALASVLGRRLNQTDSEHTAAEQRLSGLRAEISMLQESSKAISHDLAEEQYRDLLQEAGDDFLARLEFDATRFSNATLADRVTALIRRASAATGVLSDLMAKAERIKKLTDTISTAPDQATLNGEIRALEAEILATEANVSEKRDQLNACMRDISSQRADIDVKSQAHGKVQAALSQIRTIVTSDSCPVCKRPIERQKLLAIIDDGIGTAGAETSLLMEKLNLQEAIRARLKIELDQVNGLLGEKRKAIQELRVTLEHREDLDGLITEFRSSPAASRWSALLDRAQLSFRDLRPALSTVESLNRRATALSRTIDSLANIGLLPLRLREREKLLDTSTNADRSSRELREAILALEKCRDAVSHAQVGLVEATLESYKPLISSLYRRMHPHQLFTEIGFEVTKTAYGGELYFRVFTPGGNTSAYPSTIFSTSQLNIVAVALFLAMNLRAGSTMPILMLDDPIHSMDDLNVLGFCDLMRQIKTKRQLFISTHDKDLYGLLLNKLRPSNPQETVHGFWFDDWSREGPTIRRDLSQFVPNQIAWTEFNDIRHQPQA